LRALRRRQPRSGERSCLVATMQPTCAVETENQDLKLTPAPREATICDGLDCPSFAAG